MSKLKRVSPPMTTRPAVGWSGKYKGQVSNTRPVVDFTARIVPHFAGVAIPLEEAHILWQR
jgi:starch phosphorylase